MKRIIGLGLLAIVVLAAGLLHADADPFVGERLVYEFGWKGFVAARAEINIDEAQYLGVDCYKIEILLNSLPKLDWIWKVRDRMVSFTRKSDLVPERFVFKQREGKFYLDTEVLLDRTTGVLNSTRTRIKGGKTKDYTPKSANAEGMTDPLGALLFLRKQDLKVGETYKVNSFDGKRTHEVQYKVERQEKLKTRFGEFDTFVVIPTLAKSSGGKADSIQAEKVKKVLVWLTTTPEHMVLRVESKAWIGSVYAELVKK